MNWEPMIEYGCPKWPDVALRISKCPVWQAAMTGQALWGGGGHHVWGGVWTDGAGITLSCGERLGGLVMPDIRQPCTIGVLLALAEIGINRLHPGTGPLSIRHHGGGFVEVRCDIGAVLLSRVDRGMQDSYMGWADRANALAPVLERLAERLSETGRLPPAAQA